jgi:hypothetical protein
MFVRKGGTWFSFYIPDNFRLYRQSRIAVLSIWLGGYSVLGMGWRELNGDEA